MELSTLTIEELSNKIKLELSTRLSSAEYMLWIDPLVPYSFNNGQLVYSAPSNHVCVTLLAHYAQRFMEVIADLKLQVMDVLFVPKEELERMDGVTIKDAEEVQPAAPKKINTFKSIYTFDNFVVADNNKMAYYSAFTVAENPGAKDELLALNPLYIYGGVGLGKTHLLHAIGNYLYENNPTLDVVYTTAEKISNEYFASLSKYTTDKDSYRKFRQKYASCDVLMVDDVQFMQKKGGLQEVFFHIFNDLYINGKQIVLSSDRPPKEINDIEDRLRSRFECGLMTDIYTPSLDTRINIIKKKLEGTGNHLGEDVIYFLAETVNSNIRELEGALLKVIMFANLTHQEPTLEVAKIAVKEKEQEKTVQVDSDKIINFVSEYFRVPATDIIGKKKTKDIAEARMIAIYLVCDILNLPLVSVGQIFGGRDHTTIIYSRDKIAAQIQTNPTTAKVIKDIKAEFNCQ